MVDALAAPDLLENPRLFVQMIVRDQERDRLADHFLGGVAEQALGADVPAHDGPVQVLADDRVVGRFDDGSEPLARGIRSLTHLVRAKAVQGETDLARNRDGKRRFLVEEGVRRRVIGHEFTDHATVDRQWNEGARADPFPLDHGLQRLRFVGAVDIADVDRDGLSFPRLPGAMTLDRAAIALRNAARGDELHHSGIVEQEDRGAAAVQPVQDGVQRRLVDVGARMGAEEPIGQLIERRGIGPRTGDFGHSTHCPRGAPVRMSPSPCHRRALPPLTHEKSRGGRKGSR